MPENVEQIRVEFVGDASKLEKASKDADSALDRTNDAVERSKSKWQTVVDAMTRFSPKFKDISEDFNGVTEQMQDALGGIAKSSKLMKVAVIGAVVAVAAKAVQAMWKVMDNAANYFDSREWDKAQEALDVSKSKFTTAVGAFTSPIVNGAKRVFGGILDGLTWALKKIYAGFNLVYGFIKGYLTPTIEAIKSVIDAIGKALSTVVEYIKRGLQSIAGLFGVQLFAEGNKAAENMEESMDAAGEAAQLATGALQGFDKLNTMDVTGDVETSEEMKETAEAMQDLGEQIGSKWAEKFGNLFSVFKNVDLGSVWDGFVNAGSNAWSKIKGFGEWAWNGLSQVGTTVWNTLSGVASGVWQGIQTVGTTVWNVLSSSGSTLWATFQSIGTTVWANISGVATSIWGGISGVANSIWGEIQSIGTTVWNVLGDVGTTIWDAISGSATAVWERIKQVGSVVWGALESAGSAIWGPISKVATAAWNGICTLATGIWESIKTIGETVWNVISGVAIKVWNTISEFAMKVWNGIKVVATAVWNVISGVATAVWNGISSLATSIWEGIKSTGTTVWNVISGVATGVWNGISSLATKVWGGIQAIAGGVWDTISTFATTVWTGIQNFATTVWNVISAPILAIWETFKTLGEKAWAGLQTIGETFNRVVIEPIKSTVKWILEKVQTIMNQINSAKEFVGGIGEGIGNVVGGTVDAIKGALGFAANGAVIEPNDPHLVMVGDNKREQEIISPLSTIRQAVSEAIAASGGVGSTRPINISLQIDGKEFARATYDDIKSEGMRRGVSI